MKKVLLTAISAVVAASAMAAPIEAKPVSELLGLRHAPAAGGNVFAAYGSQVRGTAARNANGPMKITGVDNSDPTKVNIVGCVVSPDHITGMWTYTPDGWNPSRLNSNANGVYATGGGLAAGQYYYVTQYREAMGFEEIKSINYEMYKDWEEYDAYTADISVVATTVAYSENRDQAFGCFINAERTGYVFCEYNYEYFKIKRTICPIETEKVWAGCAFSSDNTLYAITRQGELYTVDLATGDMTLVGATGIEATYMADATIDTNTDIMYWCVNSDTQNALYTVDLNTATPTKLYDLINEEQICGMFIPHDVVTPAQAPDAISSVSLSFSGAALTGKVSFSLPRYQYDQQALLDATVELTWVLKVNGKEVATGTGLPNARINAEVTVDKADSYNFSVVVKNEAGESPAKASRKYLGPDAPLAPATFNLSLSGSTINLSWNSPNSSGVNGGYVQTSAATYTVVRYPDMKVIADNITARSATDEIVVGDEAVEYSYGLIAEVNGFKAPEKKSASFIVGPIVPPTEIKFESALSVFGWNFLEAQEKADNYLWRYYSNALYLTSSSKNGQDDYAISPAVTVKGGASYPFSIDIRTSSYYEETFEVLWGTEPTIEAMTNVIIPETSVKSTTAVTYSGEIVPTTDGKIYFAIRDKSASYSQIYVLGITIGEGLVNSVPAATDFTVKPATDGSAQAVVTYTLPTTTVDGQALTTASALTKVEILRDDEVIYTLSENLPAEEATYTDTEGLTLGKHTYDVIAYNAFGAGKKNPVEVTVGPGIPAAPSNVLMLEEGNTGKVTVTWDPVTTDVDGNEILASAVTYKVIDRASQVVAENLTETSFSAQAVEPGTQAFAQYGVYAVTVGGESKLAGSAYKPVGAPYATPWKESFADGQVSSIFGYNYIKDTDPWQFGTNSDWSATPQDGDNGLAYFEAYGGVKTALVTGKIDLTDVPNPAFTYYTYRYSYSDYSNTIEIEADCGDGEGFVLVQSDPIFIGEAYEWHKVVVDLSKYEGKSVIFRIIPSCTDPKNQGAFYFIDNLRVATHTEYNLTATRIDAPGAVKVNEEFEINVTVTNTGDNEVRAYDVELYSGDEFIASKAGSAIAPEASAVITFVTSNTVLDGASRDYHAVIVCSNDEMEADDVTETVTVGIVAPAVPLPTNLVAEAKDEAVSLTWTAPDLTNGAPAAYTETFENESDWSASVEGWKMIDGDQAPLISIRNPEFGFTAGKLAAWWITNQNWNANSATLWASHSGNKYLVSGSVQRGNNNPVQCDDWAISPRLYGGEQIITLYARSFYSEGASEGLYQEDFEVLYSTSTTNVSDFVSAGYVTKVPFSWTKYSFSVPEGALYFAIRSRSYDKFFLFIDDVTYIPANGEAATYDLKGYNVYRNGVKINSALVTEPAFIDENARAGFNHTYVVTANYTAGESRPSNEAYITLSGIDGVNNATVAIVGGEGYITITGAEGLSVEVFNAQGMAVAAINDAPATARVAVAAGVYIVRVANSTAKVVVK